MIIDSVYLAQTLYKKVKIVDSENLIHEGIVDLYESEFDSGYNEALVGLDNGIFLRQSEIKDIEILD